MTEFSLIDIGTLEKTLRSLNSSTCSLDIIPTNFLKDIAHLLSDNILKIVNLSLQSGIFPESLKMAVVKPLLKKKSLDSSVLNNYRPVSNLPFIGKLIEKLHREYLDDI